MSKSVPEPWAAPMVKAKLVDPRNGTPSMRALAEKAATTTSTVSAMVGGTRDTSSDVIERVAKAINVPADEVHRWVGKARTEARPFKPHRDANLLTAEEQEAVNELIRLLAMSKRKGGGVRDKRSAPTKLAGSREDWELAADDEEHDIEDEQVQE